MDRMVIHVDIVIVSYNAERYIKQALESVFMQRMKDNVQARVIIADDCSTDKTVEIIRTMERSSPWSFVFLSEPDNLGITANYKRVFDYCVDGRADYVAILEGDDYWSSPYHIQNHIDFLDVHREASMSVNYYNPFSVNEDGSISIWPRQNEQRFTKMYNLDQMLECNYIGNFSSCSFRKTALSQINPKIYEIDVPNLDDWMMGIEMARFGFVAHLPSYTTMYRLSQNSVYSSKKNTEKMDEIYRRYHLYHEYIGGHYYEKCLEEESKQWKEDNWSPFRRDIQHLLINAKEYAIRLGAYFLPKNKKKKLKRLFSSKLKVDGDNYANI